jgi:hypothetical protein
MHVSVDVSDVEFSKNFVGDSVLDGKNYRVGGLVGLQITIKVEPGTSDAEGQSVRNYGSMNRCGHFQDKQ